MDLEGLKGSAPEVAPGRLLRERGFGPWSLGVVALQGLGRYDLGLVSDLGLVKLFASVTGRWPERADETAELLAPYGEWQGLASVFLLAGWKRGLVPGRARRARESRFPPRRVWRNGPRRRGAAGRARQGRRERPYRGMGATEDAASRRSGAPPRHRACFAKPSSGNEHRLAQDRRPRRRADRRGTHIRASLLGVAETGRDRSDGAPRRAGRGAPRAAWRRGHALESRRRGRRSARRHRRQAPGHRGLARRDRRAARAGADRALGRRRDPYLAHREPPGGGRPGRARDAEHAVDRARGNRRAVGRRARGRRAPRPGRGGAVAPRQGRPRSRRARSTRSRLSRAPARPTSPCSPRR